MALQSLKSPGEVEEMTNTIMSDLQTGELGLKQETKPSLVRAIPEGKAKVSVYHVKYRSKPQGYQLCIQILTFFGTLAPAQADSWQQPSVNDWRSTESKAQIYVPRGEILATQD